MRISLQTTTRQLQNANNNVRFSIKRQLTDHLLVRLIQILIQEKIIQHQQLWTELSVRHVCCLTTNWWLSLSVPGITILLPGIKQRQYVFFRDWFIGVLWFGALGNDRMDVGLNELRQKWVQRKTAAADLAVYPFLEKSNVIQVNKLELNMFLFLIIFHLPILQRHLIVVWCLL